MILLPMTSNLLLQDHSLSRRHGEEELGEFQIPTFGKHNVMNATAVIATLYVAGFDLQLVAEHLKTFGGVKRRFTEKSG